MYGRKSACSRPGPLPAKSGACLSDRSSALALDRLAVRSRRGKDLDCSAFTTNINVIAKQHDGERATNDTSPPVRHTTRLRSS